MQTALPARRDPLLSRSTPLLLTLIAATLIGWATPSFAQGANSPTRGVRLLSESVSDSWDASALELNPAGIGFIDGWNFAFYHATFGEKDGEGDSVFFAARIIGPWTVGFGMQFLRWSQFGGDYLKLTITNTLNLHRTFAIGFSYNFFVDDKDRDIRKLGSFDVGLIYRPFSWLSLGLAVKDIDTPLFRGKPLNRFYDVAVGLRPGDEPRYSLSLGMRIEENAATVDPYLAFRFEPLDGWVLLGQAGLMRRSSRNNFYASFGMEFNFSLIGAGAGYQFERMNGKNTHGFTTYFRVSSRAFRTLLRPRQIYPVLELGGGLTEYNRSGLFATKRPTLFAYVHAIHYYRLDKSVAGLVIRLSGGGMGWAQAEEIRNALAAFQKAGKKVVVHIDSTNALGFYLASVADLLTVNPAGGVYLTGLSTTLTFFKGVMSKIGIEADFVRIGKYKSFPETFTRRSPTEPNKMVRNSLLDGIFGHFLDSVAASRHVSRTRVREALDRGQFLPEELQRYQLIDRALNFDQLGQAIKKRWGGSPVIKTRYPSLRRQPTNWSEPNEIAILVVDGSIVEGRSRTIPLIDQRFTGSASFAKLMAQVRSNRRIKAVVVRVDSGGGSALASDIMHREILLTRKVKPVVVSFGNVAASGAYYLAAGANKIFASRTTITGSIGIFAGKFVFSGLFRWLGIDRVNFKRGRYAQLFSIDKKFDPAERRLVLQKITHFYQIFLRRVATGRRLTTQAVDKVGRGRVWLGSQAKPLGLFDSYGGLWDALMEARRLAGIDKGERIRYRLLPELGFWERIKKFFGVKTSPDLGLLGQAQQKVLQLLAPALLQYRAYEPLALMPFIIEFR
ncbi:MAG: signal peptide peptidase SppA [Myxococcales bacterium]|nr:signal peptide peptidase SppA [Myxococcales bacterium]